MKLLFAILVVTQILEIKSMNNFADTACGTKSAYRFGKIVGGQNAIEHEFPWMVSVTRRGHHFCGGSIISKRHIITAGHCMCGGFDFLEPSSIKITLAQHDLTKSSGKKYEMSVRSISTHPDYLCRKPRNDIAIIELEKDLQWSDEVRPVCLPNGAAESGYTNFDNNLATVAGWGWLNEHTQNGGRADVLQKVNVNVVENGVCKEWFKSQGKKTKIQDTQMCAGYKEGGSDACSADSGGPLMVNTNDQMVVVGVVSTGIGCARPFLPGLYTRVSEYIPWLRSIVNP